MLKISVLVLFLGYLENYAHRCCKMFSRFGEKQYLDKRKSGKILLSMQMSLKSKE